MFTYNGYAGKMPQITIFALFLFMLPTLAFSDEIRVGGGAAPIENIFKKIKDPFEKATGIILTLKADGPNQALIDLDQGKLDMATADLV